MAPPERRVDVEAEARACVRVERHTEPPEWGTEWYVSVRTADGWSLLSAHTDENEATLQADIVTDAIRAALAAPRPADTGREWARLDVCRGCGDHVYPHDGCPHCANNGAVVDKCIRVLAAAPPPAPARTVMPTESAAGMDVYRLTVINDCIEVWKNGERVAMESPRPTDTGAIVAKVRAALSEIRSCLCGWRRESPATHSHVGGCPYAVILDALPQLLAEAPPTSAHARGR